MTNRSISKTFLRKSFLLPKAACGWLRRSLLGLLFPVLLGGLCNQLPAGESPLPIKAVIVTMFEVGAVAGDVPGEFQLWYEREKLHKRFPLPHAHSDIYANEEVSVIGFITGVGVAKAAASTMAVGLDPRFDLRKAYWIIAGISGIDPADGSLGSAAWAEYVVDGGLAHEIDAREIPASWPTGYTPLGIAQPYTMPPGGPNENTTQVFALNRNLVEWAYQLTKDLRLPDSAAMAKRRMDFIGYPKARKPPFVLKGDNLADSTFWHGKLMTRFGNDWVKFWTDGKGNFTTKAMEDSGTLQALAYLAESGRADRDRVLLLRTASNYTMQSPDMTASQSLAREGGASYSAFHESVEAAYEVAGRVLHEILAHWEKWENEIPGTKRK